MKKNITINLFGTLYNIDEDAYQLLDNYLQSMKRYFGTKDGGEEIADDIEHRVAELLWEKKEQGIEAINLDIIKEIIGKIGNAEEIAGDEETESSNHSAENGNIYTEADDFDSSTATLWERMRHHFQNRRLYRDPDEQLLGGVCSGLAHYFGLGGSVLWRLLLLVLFFVEGIGLLTYLILWLIIPLARTPEDKLRMKGMQLNTNNINKQIIHDHQNIQSGNNNGNTASGCLKLIFGFLILAPLAFAIFIIFMFTIGGLGVIGGLGSAVIASSEFFPLNTMLESCGTMMFVGIGCVFVILVIVFILLLRLIFGSGKPMSKWMRIVIGVIVASCLAFGVYSIAQTVTQYFTIYNEYRANQHRTRMAYKSNQDFKPQPHLDIPHLDETGFTIINNSCNRCTWSGDYPTGDRQRRYLDACDYALLEFTAEKTDTIAPGTYTLCALVRAEDEGGYLYVKVGHDNQYTENMVSIPAHANEGGNLWKWACGNTTLSEIQEFYPELSNDSIRKNIAFANNGKGFGWQLMTIRGIKVKKGEYVKYGITTESDIIGEEPECDWVSASDFVLTRTDKKAKK